MSICVCCVRCLYADVWPSAKISHPSRGPSSNASTTTNMALNVFVAHSNKQRASRGSVITTGPRVPPRKQKKKELRIPTDGYPLRCIKRNSSTYINAAIFSYVYVYCARQIEVGMSIDSVVINVKVRTLVLCGLDGHVFPRFCARLKKKRDKGKARKKERKTNDDDDGLHNALLTICSSVPFSLFYIIYMGRRRRESGWANCLFL